MTIDEQNYMSIKLKILYWFR